MLTHRHCELSRLKPAAFAAPSDTKALRDTKASPSETCTKSATTDRPCIICEERAFGVRIRERAHLHFSTMRFESGNNRNNL